MLPAHDTRSAYSNPVVASKAADDDAMSAFILAFQGRYLLISTDCLQGMSQNPQSLPREVAFSSVSAVVIASAVLLRFAFVG